MRMKVVNQVSLPVFIALTLASCTTGPDSGVPEGVRFTVDRTEYVAVQTQDEPLIRYEFQVIARLENQSDHTLYLDRCHPDDSVPIWGIRLVAPENPDGAAYGLNWACGGGASPIAVVPGATRLDTLRVSGPNGWQGGVPVGQFDGVFRVGYVTLTCSPPVPCSSPVDFIVSQRFSVRR